MPNTEPNKNAIAMAAVDANPLTLIEEHEVASQSLIERRRKEHDTALERAEEIEQQAMNMLAQARTLREKAFAEDNIIRRIKAGLA